MLSQLVVIKMEFNHVPTIKCCENVVLLWFSFIAISYL